MLVLPSNPRWKDGAPKSICDFRDVVADRLSDEWVVSLLAYDNDAPEDTQAISAELKAACGELVVSITRHAEFDTILIGLMGNKPEIPFEDLAAACEWTDEKNVYELAEQDPDEFQPLFSLEDSLGLLDSSRDDLAEKLKDFHFTRKLRKIAKEFSNRLLGDDG